MVPSDDAEKTTPRQVKRLGCRLKRAVDFTVETSYPPLPSFIPLSGLTFTTLVSAKTLAPYFSASKDSSGPAYSWRRGGNPSCSRRSPGRSSAPAPLRRNRGQERSVRQALLREIER